MANFLSALRQRGDVVVAVAMVALLGIMLLPIPKFMLDLLLSFSIALAVVIMITSVYINKPLDFYVFPSLLLMTTLYRLSLNIATTKLILLKGNEGSDAVGQVIKSFGSFVVGGNYTIGFIVFLILVIVNFVVITKGSVRIAEVSARFTLDAMPGKQMAIDADLNTGLIDESEARRRRAAIAEEADFYGAMDGASKFVRGDAIAGLLITGVNILGGLVVGTLQKGMPVAEAAKTYTILTVGDGLVSQIPALLISTAAGIVVSRAGRESNLGRDITRQVFLNPKSLLTASGILLAIGLVPGLPHVSFIIIALLAGGLAYYFSKAAAGGQEAPEEEERPAEEAEPRIETYLEVDPLSLEIGYGLIPLIEERGELLKKIKAMRRQLASSMGFIVPPIHIKDNLQLRPHEYSLLIRGMEASKGEIMMDHWLAVQTSEDAGKIEGIPTKDPAFGLPAYWIEERQIERSQQSGYMIVDTANVIVTHLTELIKGNGWELLSRGDVQNLLDNVTKTYPRIVEELIPEHITLGGVQRVLQNLLREGVPINDLVTILETLLDHAPSVKDVELLTEYVRHALSRYITKQYMEKDGTIPVFTLDPKFEKSFSKSLQTGEAINPEAVSRLMKGIEKVFRKENLRGLQPVILCSTQVRRVLRRLMEKFLPAVAVLSNSDISSAARLHTMGMVRYED